jgi:hypothetical protein
MAEENTPNDGGTGNTGSENTGGNDGSQRPDWLLPKFSSVEAQAKAYVEAQKLLGQRSNGGSGGSPSIPDGGAPKAGSLDVSNLFSEWVANNGFSEETKAKLVQQGQDINTVDTLMRGQKALADQAYSELMSHAGGEDSYQKMVQWAATNYSAEERKVFNAMVASNDPVQRKMAVDGLQARYGMVNGFEGLFQEFQNSGTPGAAPITPYATKSEFLKDVKSKEYKSDPTFRARVEARAKLSNNV